MILTIKYKVFKVQNKSVTDDDLHIYSLEMKSVLIVFIYLEQKYETLKGGGGEQLTQHMCLAICLLNVEGFKLMSTIILWLPSGSACCRKCSTSLVAKMLLCTNVPIIGNISYEMPTLIKYLPDIGNICIEMPLLQKYWLYVGTIFAV